MNENTYTEIPPKNSESTKLKPWRMPMVEELAIGQTEDWLFASGSDSDIFPADPQSYAS